MNETMALYRQVFRPTTAGPSWSTAPPRAAIEAAMVSVLAARATRRWWSRPAFGGLLTEIAERWGAPGLGGLRVDLGNGRAAEGHRGGGRLGPAGCCWPWCMATPSTTMAQLLEGIGELCRRYGALSYVDADGDPGRPGPGGRRAGARYRHRRPAEVPGWTLGIAPITISDRAAEHIFQRRHVEQDCSPASRTEAPDRLQLLRPGHDHGLLVREAAEPLHRSPPPCSMARANAPGW